MAWSQEQLANARIIAQVGRDMGASPRDIQIALMTAMQESTLRNLNYGDRDSLGLFQQRPSQGWGSRSQVTDPQYASRKFYEGLLALGNRDGMRLTEAAQAVQRSAFPEAYAKHEGEAGRILASLGLGGDSGSQDPFTVTSTITTEGVAQRDVSDLSSNDPVPPPTAMGVGAPAPIGVDATRPFGTAAPGAPTDVPSSAPPEVDRTTQSEVVSTEEYTKGSFGGGGEASGDVGKMIAFAKSLVGTPYVWGGDGPLGLDCSGFTTMVFKQLGINLPRVSYQQAEMSRPVGRGDLQPGDMFFEDFVARNDNLGGGGADHTGIYIGNGMVIEANGSAGEVRISPLRSTMWFGRVL